MLTNNEISKIKVGEETYFLKDNVARDYINLINGIKVNTPITISYWTGDLPQNPTNGLYWWDPYNKVLRERVDNEWRIYTDLLNKLYVVLAGIYAYDGADMVGLSDRPVILIHFKGNISDLVKNAALPGQYWYQSLTLKRKGANNTWINIPLSTTSTLYIDCSSDEQEDYSINIWTGDRFQPIFKANREVYAVKLWGADINEDSGYGLKSGDYWYYQGTAFLKAIVDNPTFDVDETEDDFIDWNYIPLNPHAIYIDISQHDPIHPLENLPTIYVWIGTSRNGYFVPIAGGNSDDESSPINVKLSWDSASNTDVVSKGAINNELGVKISNIENIINELGNEIPTDAEEITGFEVTDESTGTKEYHIGLSNFESGKSYVIKNDVILDENIIIPSGTSLYVNGSITSVDGTKTITGQNTKFDAPFKKIFNNVIIVGTWDCTAKPDWFGAKSDNVNYGEWPLVFYGGDINNISNVNTSTIYSAEVKNPYSFIDETLPVVQNTASTTEAENDRLDLFGQYRPKDVYYDTVGQRFVLKIGSAYYTKWTNSSIWNDTFTGKARLDTLFCAMKDSSGHYKLLQCRAKGTSSLDELHYAALKHLMPKDETTNPNGTGEISSATVTALDGHFGLMLPQGRAFYFSANYNKHTWNSELDSSTNDSEEISGATNYFQRAILMSGGKISLKKDGCYYFSSVLPSQDCYLYIGSKTDFIMEGNNATLLFEPRGDANNYPSDHTGVRIKNSTHVYIKDVCMTSVRDKITCAYGLNFFVSPSYEYRIADLAGSNLIFVQEDASLDVVLDNINISKGYAGIETNHSTGQREGTLKVLNSRIVDVQGCLSTSVQSLVIFENCYLRTQILNCTGGHIYYQRSGVVEDNPKHSYKAVLVNTICEAGDGTTCALFFPNNAFFRSRVSMEFERCQIIGYNAIHAFTGGSCVSFKSSVLKRAFNFTVGSSYSVVTPIYDAFISGNMGTLTFDDCTVQINVNNSGYSGGQIINTIGTSSLGHKGVLRARNTVFSSDYSTPIQMCGHLYLDSCTFYNQNTNAAVTYINNADWGVVDIENCRVEMNAGTGSKFLNMGYSTSSLSIRYNHFFLPNHSYVYTPANSDTLVGHVVKGNTLACIEGNTVHLCDKDTGGYFRYNRYGYTTKASEYPSSFINFDNREDNSSAEVQELKNIVLGGSETATNSGLWEERTLYSTAVDNTYAATDLNKTYKVTNAGTRCKIQYEIKLDNSGSLTEWTTPNLTPLTAVRYGEEGTGTITIRSSSNGPVIAKISINADSPIPDGVSIEDYPIGLKVACQIFKAFDDAGFYVTTVGANLTGYRSGIVLRSKGGVSAPTNYFVCESDIAIYNPSALEPVYYTLALIRYTYNGNRDWADGADAEWEEVSGSVMDRLSNLEENSGIANKIPTTMPSNPSIGNIFYSVEYDELYVYTGTTWKSFSPS